MLSTPSELHQHDAPPRARGWLGLVPMPVAPTLSPWLPALQAQSEALLLPRLGSVVAAPQLLGPVWAHRRNADRRGGGVRRTPAVTLSTAAAAAAAADAVAAAAAAAAAAARQPDAPPSPVADLPSLPLDGYLRQRLFHRVPHRPRTPGKQTGSQAGLLPTRLHLALDRDRH